MRGPARFGPGELVGPLLIVMLTGAVIATFITAILLTRGGVGGETVGEEVVGEVSPTPAGTAPTGGGPTVEIAMIPVIQFDKTELTIAANTPVEVFADNVDTGVPHNFAVYESQEAYQTGGTDAALAATAICTAPCQDTLTLELEPGEYFFQCDVHPIQMVGTLVVEG